MNAFERHNIRHLSASSLNSFAAEPAMWVMERLLKKWGPRGTAATRGHAIEDGVTHGLLNPAASIEECQAVAIARFDRDAGLSTHPLREKHKSTVAPSVPIALHELRQYGVPDMVQTKLEITIPDIAVPLHGVIDYGWTSHGIILDLKTSDRLASKISDAHARQGCIYVYQTNRQMRFAYTSPKLIGVYVLEKPEEYVVALQQIARKLERFLSVSNDPHELAGMIAPDYDDFRWKDPIQRANGRAIFGF